MPKKVKMADIAAKLKVSTVTVSKALSGQKGVSEELREEIKQLAAEMGYRKYSVNPGEVRKGYDIGVIVSRRYIETKESFCWNLYQVINRIAVQNNSFVMLEVIDSEAESKAVPPKLLKENKIDGLLVLGGFPSGYLHTLRKKCFQPMVYVDFYDAKAKEDCVIANNFYGMWEVTNYLFDKGHTDIVFVGAALSDSNSTDRYFGYMKSLEEHGKTVQQNRVPGDRDREGRSYEMIKLPEKMPTAFVCNCSMDANRLIYTLNDAGYRVPEDISVVGFGDIPQQDLGKISLTTYDINRNAMAETAMHLILEKMSGKETSHKLHIIEGHLMERMSVKEIKEEENEDNCYRRR